MPYIGKEPEHGNYQLLDALTLPDGVFNGSRTVFNLTADSVAVYPSTPASLIISLGGTIQAPNTAYTVSGGQITFASAPATNTVFFGVSLGDTLDIGTPSDDSVNSQHYVDGSIDNVHLATGIDAVKLADGSVTNTEFQYINTLSSNAQTQITAKAPIASPTFTTGATSPSFITGNSGTIKLMDANGSNFASIAAHATTTADIAYTWPPAGPGTSGFALTATTAGVMSWAAAGTTISTNADNRIITGSDTADTLNGETNLMYDGNVLHVKNAGTASSIQLHCEVSNIHYVALKSPAHSTFTGGSWTLTLPGIDGTSGQFLQTNGSGVTSWAAAGDVTLTGTQTLTNKTLTSPVIAGSVTHASNLNLYAGSGLDVNIGHGSTTILSVDGGTLQANLNSGAVLDTSVANTLLSLTDAATWTTVLGGITTGGQAYSTIDTVGSFLRISAGGAVGIIVDTTGAVSKPLQPCVMARKNASTNNSTGNGELLTVDFTGEIFDQNSDFASNTTFTAPVTGKYLVSSSVRFAGVTAASSSIDMVFVTSNRSGRLFYREETSSDVNPYAEGTCGNSIVTDMDVNDTLTITFTVSGQGTTADIVGLTAMNDTYLSVILVA